MGSAVRVEKKICGPKIIAARCQSCVGVFEDFRMSQKQQNFGELNSQS